MKPPVFDIDVEAFWRDPYPQLARLRAEASVAFVPQLGAVVFSRRDDIFTCEKMIDVFSSDQPGGLMNVLMGQNMMRKDGEPHLRERKDAFPALSPRTVRDVWTAGFEKDTDAILDGLESREKFDLVTDYAMPVSGSALCRVTGLRNLKPTEMDFVSQGMIDGIANYAGDKDIEARCNKATGMIDAAIDEMMPVLSKAPDTCLLSVLMQSDQSLDSIRANVKLAISGGQNEPRDAIAGTAFALLTHREQLGKINDGANTWKRAFEEYARWMSPIGMSPRVIAKPFTWNGIDLEPGMRTFFMFSSANRDEAVFENPDAFDITRDTAKAIAFGAGPHFCAGAGVSRVLIGGVALPKLFERFPDLTLVGDVPFGGWAFRGPLKVQVQTGK